MKKLILCLALLPGILTALTATASLTPAPPAAFIHVVISSKSYWDGPTKSCLPREKGGCCHLWIEGMVPGPGEIGGDLLPAGGRTLQLVVKLQKGLKNDVWQSGFRDNTYTLDGAITFEPEVLARLGLDRNFTIPAGTYPCSTSGDLATITFR